MHASLKYSYAVRVRAIDAAILLLAKAGCSVTRSDDGATTCLMVTNPLDPTDRIGELAQAALESPCDTNE